MNLYFYCFSFLLVIGLGTVEPSALLNWYSTRWAFLLVSGWCLSTEISQFLITHFGNSRVRGSMLVWARESQLSRTLIRIFIRTQYQSSQMLSLLIFCMLGTSEILRLKSLERVAPTIAVRGNIDTEGQPSLTTCY